MMYICGCLLVLIAFVIGVAACMRSSQISEQLHEREGDE